MLLLLAGSMQQVLAQSPTTGGPTPQATSATEVPLDGGASLLLAGGVAYGLRKLRQRRK
ncbi:MAG: PID-CTERM protein-sorting domain-containing protein [Janthinobacterium lividum]